MYSAMEFWLTLASFAGLCGVVTYGFIWKIKRDNEKDKP